MNLLPHHRCHDPAELMRGWKRVARQAQLRVWELCRVEGMPVIWLESASARAGAAAVYLSAGIHGDEPAAPAGLLLWAQQNVERLRHEAFVLFPCLNPLGLLLNQRMDGRGADLNRCFHLVDDPVCGPWREVVRNRNLRLGLCLHEDYDAQGVYLYELSRHARGWSRDVLQRCVSERLPVDARSRIEGSRVHEGIIHRQRKPRHLPGLPEAVVLYELGCPITLTFETPSEFCLNDRVEAQVTFIEAALNHTPARAA